MEHWSRSPEAGIRAEVRQPYVGVGAGYSPEDPGRFVEFTGKSTEHPDEVLFIALAQDEKTYRALAEMPEQHKFFERMSQLMDGNIRWEDVQLDMTIEP